MQESTKTRLVSVCRAELEVSEDVRFFILFDIMCFKYSCLGMARRNVLLKITLLFGLIITLITGMVSHTTGCPKKKQGLVFRAHFRGLNDLKIIKVE